jgi:hypothetical protein
MDSKRRKGRIVLAALLAFAAATPFLIQVAARWRKAIDGEVFLWNIIAAFAFNAASYLARWLLTKSWRRTFLRGRLPVLIDLAKLWAFFVCAILILALIAGLIAGPPFAGITLRALVSGLLGFGVLSLVGNALLNAVIVLRHFRGTLAGSSREVKGLRGWL